MNQKVCVFDIKCAKMLRKNPMRRLKQKDI